MDLSWFKEHKMVVGAGVVGLIILILLLKSSGSGAASSATTDDGTAELAAESQLAQTQAASNAQQLQAQTAQQTAALQGQVATQQIAAQLSATENTNDDQLAAILAQTTAGLTATESSNATSVQNNTITTGGQVAINQSNNDAQTAQQQANLEYAENLQGQQDAVLTAQINAGVDENANNNATSLAETNTAAQYQSYLASLQAGIASQGIASNTTVALAGLSDQTTLESQGQSDQFSLDQYIEQNAGSKQNSGLDATDQTSIFASLINPAAATGVPGASASVANNATNATTSTINGLISTAGSITNGVVKGLFA